MRWSVENGYSHQCVCGATWYDSDGIPCHVLCDTCGEMIDSEGGPTCPSCEATRKAIRTRERSANVKYLARYARNIKKKETMR